jgi:two-component system sensor histidine kinase TtrS
MTHTRCLFLLLALLCGVAPTVLAQETAILIGVLSHRGDEATLRTWGPTAEYLGTQLPDYHFTIVPLEFEEVAPAVAYRRVDFVLVNSGMYVDLEVHQGVSRIATLNNRHGDKSYNTFGGVLFTRAARTDLATLDDLRGKRFAAVNKDSLGGYQMQWREMQGVGLDPRLDLAETLFANTHDAVVRRVLAGEADFGAVRTNILERMIEEGELQPNAVRVIGARASEEFPLLASTRLYPEWPFAKAPWTANELAQRVAVALLQMPRDHPAALAGRYAGWTVPLDYQPVHDLFQELGIGPYAKLRFTFADVLDKYRGAFIAGALMLGLLVLLAGWIAHLNRRLEEARHGIESRFELILEAVGDGVSGVDTDGTITFVNPEMTRLTGWTAAELIGRNQHDLLHHSHADGRPYPKRDCPVGATFHQNRAHHVDDEVFWRKDGTSFPVEYASAPLRDRDGGVLGAVIVCRDISARKAAEEEQRRHLTEMAHVARLSTMGEMASQIAHELNQPLSAITNYAGACVRRLRDDRADRDSLLEAMELLSTQAHRAAQIVRQIRDFIRKRDPERGPVDINALIEQTAAMVDLETHRFGVDLELELADELPPVTGIMIELEQVLMNLLRNAIESVTHNPAGRRRVVVHSRFEPSGEIHLEVHDNGPGMEPSVLSELFTPFYTTKASGMGLGLAISRRIVEAHAGRLWADDARDGGATFHVTLPGVAAEARDVA